MEEFSDVEDWMDRYGMIIDLGNNLPEINEAYKTPDNLIEGCQSRVWLNADLTPDGRVHYTADSDAIIVKGIISLLIRCSTIRPLTIFSRPTCISSMI